MSSVRNCETFAPKVPTAARLDGLLPSFGCNHATSLPSSSSPALQASLKVWLFGGDVMETYRQIIEAAVSQVSGGDVPPGVQVSDVTFAGVPVRVFQPPAGGEGHLRRGLVYFHGGGWVIGSTSEHTHNPTHTQTGFTLTFGNSPSALHFFPPETPGYDLLGRKASDELNAVVVSVE